MTLNEYLEKNNETAYSFAQKNMISFPTVQKAKSGGMVRKDIAKKIVKATRKLVTMEELGY